MKLDIPSVGSPMPRVDAWTKVRGREKYAIDEYEPDMLWAGVKRAGIPHGLIQRIDTQQAAGLPGVCPIVTRPDVPGTNRQDIVHKDQPFLAGSRIRHGGEPVALILAENRECDTGRPGGYGPLRSGEFQLLPTPGGHRDGGGPDDPLPGKVAERLTGGDP